MASGIRAEIRVDPAGSCPVTAAARKLDAPIDSVSRTTTPQSSGDVSEEFMVETDGPAPPSVDGVTFDEVFAYGSRTVYRFTRDTGPNCPRDYIEQEGCPVVDVHTDGELLSLVFHATDVTQLQAVVGRLREQFPTVDVQRLLRSDGEAEDHSLAFVDRTRLTDRQREVIETAYEMGYFDYPKGANAGDVADELDISRATLTEHLAAAQSKLLDAILDS